MEKKMVTMSQRRGLLRFLFGPGRTMRVFVFTDVSPEEARIDFQLTRPYSPRHESRWATEVLPGVRGVGRHSSPQTPDDLFLLETEQGRSCAKCQAVTLNCNLKQGVCPDCDGRAEFAGFNPRLPNR